MFKLCPVCQHRCELPKLFKGFSIGVEVGVMHGHYSDVLLRRWPGAMHLIDPWVAYPEYTDRNQDHAYNYNEAMKRLELHAGRFKVWREFDSDDVADKIGMVDFAYLDGNHSPKHSAEDMRIWWPHIKPDGILAGHDLFHMEWPGVTESLVLFASVVRRDVFMVPGKGDCACGEGGIPSWYIRKG